MNKQTNQHLIGKLVRTTFNHMAKNKLQDPRLTSELIELLITVEHPNIMEYSYKIMQYESDMNQRKYLYERLFEKLITMPIDQETLLSFFYCCLTIIPTATNDDYRKLKDTIDLIKNSNEALLVIHSHLLDVVDDIKNKKYNIFTKDMMNIIVEKINKFPIGNQHPWEICNFNVQFKSFLKVVIEFMNITYTDYLKDIEDDDFFESVFEFLNCLLIVVTYYTEQYHSSQQTVSTGMTVKPMMTTTASMYIASKPFQFVAQRSNSFDFPKQIGNISLKCLACVLYHTKSLNRIIQFIGNNIELFSFDPIDISHIYYKVSYALYSDKKYDDAIDVINSFFTLKEFCFSTLENPEFKMFEKLLRIVTNEGGNFAQKLSQIMNQIGEWNEKVLNQKSILLKQIEDLILSVENDYENNAQAMFDLIQSLPKKYRRFFLIDLINYLMVFQPQTITSIPSNKREFIKILCQLFQNHYSEETNYNTFEIVRFKIYEIIAVFDPLKISFEEQIQQIIKINEEIKQNDNEEKYDRSSQIDVVLTISLCHYLIYLYSFSSTNHENKQNITHLLNAIRYIGMICKEYLKTNSFKHYGYSLLTLLTIYNGLIELYGDHTKQLTTIKLILSTISEIEISNDERILCYLKAIQCHIQMGYHGNAENFFQRIINVYGDDEIEGERLTVRVLFMIMKIWNVTNFITEENQMIEKTIEEIKEYLNSTYYKYQSTQWEHVVLESKFNDVVSLYYSRIGQFNLSIEYSRLALQNRQRIVQIINKHSNKGMKEEPIPLHPGMLLNQTQKIKIKTKIGGMLFYSLYSFISDTIQSYMHYGWLLEIRNSYIEAEQTYNNAKFIATASKSLLRLINVLSEIGELQMKLQNYDESEICFKQINELTQQITKFVSVERDMILIYMRLGDLYRKRSNFKKSQQYYKYALTTIEKVIKERVVEPFQISFRDSTHREYLVRQSLEGKIARQSFIHKEENKGLMIPQLYVEMKNRIQYKLIKLESIEGKKEISKIITQYELLLQLQHNSPITQACILNEIGKNQLKKGDKKKACQSFQKAFPIAQQYCVPKLLCSILNNFIQCDIKTSMKCFYHIGSIGISYRQRFPLIENNDILENEHSDVQLTQNIPIQWSLLCISLNEETNEMIISNCNKNYNGIILKKKFSKYSTNPSNNNELKKQIQIMKNMKKEIVDTFSLVKGKLLNQHEKEKHLSSIKRIDDTIKTVTNDLMNKVLGWMKIIFIPRVYQRNKDSDEHFSSLFKKKLQKSIIEFDVFYLLLQFIHIHSLSQTTQSIEYFNDQEMKECLQYITHSQTTSFDSKQMKELIEILKNEQISKTFTKKDLIEKIKDKTILLLLDKQLHILPWESMKTTEHFMITRIPSYQPFITSKYTQCTDIIPYITFNPSKGYYIVNPSNDLSKTSEKLLPLLKTTSWKGIHDSAPDQNELLNELEINDILLYCGHGSGEQFIPGRRIQTLKQCAIALIMGCNSVELKQEGEFEPFGILIDYLIAGSPLVCGNLWSISDTEIDIVTEKVLAWLLDSNKNGYLIECINEARNSCRFRYFMGAAITCYGFPVKKETMECEIIEIN